MLPIHGALRPLQRRAGMLALAVLLLMSLSAHAAVAKGLTARGSAFQVQVTGAKAKASVVLVSARGKVVATKRADSLGGVVFRDVKAGKGYRVRSGKTRSGALRVFTDRSAPLSTATYRQKIPAKGYGYLTTRDGTQLAINVQLPTGAGKGPYPTLIEYSGYGYANPAGGESSIAQVATLLGYAVVDVNMRGTGCSGGAFDYFEALQSLDGYDVIETVARQPWVLHHKVGMMGISYGGISQLFVAATRPPSLAAITPLSVIDNTATTLYPGGILNTGFALSWAKDRVHDALPASKTGGQAWALQRIKAGDRTCKANQDLHGEAVDLLKKTAANQFYVPKVADPLAPVTFVHKITAPTYLACQWTDEQTGGHCATLAAQFTGTKKAWFTFTNGTHIDSLDPATFTRWFDFLELYVAKRAPKLPPAVKAAAPAVFSSAMGVQGVKLPDDPIQAEPSLAAAQKAFEALPAVRIMFDNGAGSALAGGPVAGYEHSFDRFPIPGTEARSWYLGPDGALTDTAPSASSVDVFTWNGAGRSTTSFTGDTGSGGLWKATPTYHWLPEHTGDALAYVTAPLTSNTTVIGPGKVQAWIQSSAPSVDLQVTVSEVRPDGTESFVQNGWLRTSLRALDPKKSTEVAPELSLRKATAAPLPAGQWAEINVPLYYEGHAYRAGSRIRVTIAAPGGVQPIWAFGDAQPKGTATVTLVHAPGMASRLVLPVVPGLDVPTPLPPCPSLRGEACRPYAPFTNATAAQAVR